MYTNNYINTLLRANATRMRQYIKALVHVNPSCKTKKQQPAQRWPRLQAEQSHCESYMFKTQRLFYSKTKKSLSYTIL